jgi:hypothetical protein
MTIRFLKSETIADLLSHVEDDREIYIKGSFATNDLDSSLKSFESSGAVNIQQLATLILPTNKDFYEAENSEIVFGAFRDITRYQAADIRMWAYYSLTYGLPYARKRYPAKFVTNTSAEDFASSIDSHFFKPNNSRNLIRNNVLARLWWNARVVNDINTSTAPEMLRALLIHTDHRAQFMERPTQFSTNAFQAGLMYSLKKFKENNKNIYFDAPRSEQGANEMVTHYNYRACAAFLNRLGGTVNLNLLSASEIVELIAKDEESFYLRVGAN